MPLQFDIPHEEKPVIKVIGVGGGGSNAVTHMFRQGIVGVDYAICNTDKQALQSSPVPTKIPLGPELTEGRGAGSKPNIGKQACLESIEEIKEFLQDTKMVFVTAGMGGGTGTGAAPIIAKAAQEMDVLTVGIITIPFSFEGRRRTKQAVEGMDDLRKHVDSLIVISNDKLREMHGNLILAEAFGQADNILTSAARGIAEIITVEGYVNVDFEDVNTVMRGSGVAIMGTAIMEGEDRANRAIEAALSSPLLEDNKIHGADHILLNITSGSRQVTMDEIVEITEFVQEEAGYGTDLIWGHCVDENLGEKVSVTIIATGFDRDEEESPRRKRERQAIRVPLDEMKNEREQERDEDERVDSDSVIEFEEDEVRRTVEDIQEDIPKNKRPQNPIFEDELRKKRDDQRRKREREMMEQRSKKRPGKTRLSHKSIHEMEEVPAYRRKRVNLDEEGPTDDTLLSRHSIGEEEDEPMDRGNSYLHDNVD